MIGDELYKLNPRDVAQPVLVPTWSRGNTSGAAASLAVVVYTTPLDQLFRLHAWDVIATPGAAQTVNWLQAVIRDTVSGRDLAILHRDIRASAAGIFRMATSEVGPILVPAGWSVVAVAEYSGAVALNDLTGRIFGYQIPRANLSLP